MLLTLNPNPIAQELSRNEDVVGSWFDFLSIVSLKLGQVLCAIRTDERAYEHGYKWL